MVKNVTAQKELAGTDLIRSNARDVRGVKITGINYGRNIINPWTKSLKST